MTGQKKKEDLTEVLFLTLKFGKQHIMLDH